ncbi:MAG: hypothetical protein GY711_04550 [bacterium]|nr:hypothetical protein [bacterium]
MAEEEKEEPDDEQAGEGSEESSEEEKDRGPVKLVGGIVGIVAVGAILAIMAAPSTEERMVLTGPFPFQILEAPFQANALDGNLTRYVRFTPHCEFFAYEEAYLATRATDPLYLPELKTALSQSAANKTIAEMLEGIQRELFPVEIQENIAPVLFPLHIGETTFHRETDATSGLRPGFSFEKATFRGLFHDHVLKLDAIAKTLQLDDGVEMTFTGDEQDLIVRSLAGDTLYVDVSAVDPEFQGEVQVGVHGRVRKVMIVDAMAQ